MKKINVVFIGEKIGQLPNYHPVIRESLDRPPRNVKYTEVIYKKRGFQRLFPLWSLKDRTIWKIKRWARNKRTD